MNIIAFVTELSSRGIHLSVKDGQLEIDAPKGMLTDIDVQMLRLNREQLVALLTMTGGDESIDIVRQSHEGRYRVSEVQRSALMMHAASQDKSYGNIPLSFVIKGPLDHDRLERALNKVVNDHEILRTVYEQRHDDWLQVIQAPQPLNITWHDVDPEHEPAGAAERILQDSARRPFDLENEWPIRCKVVRIGHQQYWLGITFHQVAVDGYSCSLFLRLLGDAYAQSDETEIAHQFCDFVQWELQYLDTARFKAQLNQWSHTLQGAPDLHGLPCDFVRPAVLSFAGRTIEFPTAQDVFERLTAYARENRVSIFVVLHAVLSVLLARYADADDIVIGTAVANRTQPELLGMLGNVVNTLPLRVNVSSAGTFQELLDHSKKAVDEALGCQNVPFNHIVEKLRPARSASYNPVVQLMLVLQEEDQLRLTLPGLTVENKFVDPLIAKFDLTLHVYKQQGGAVMRWEYNTALFRPHTITMMAAHFSELLSQVLRNPDIELSRLVLSGAGAASSTATTSMPSPRLIDEWILDHVSRTPEAIAVMDATVTLTFGQLNERATSLAKGLRSLCDMQQGKHFHVGICMEKTADLVTGFVGILKAGAAYVPFDPGYPAARLDFMIKDANLNVLLVDRELPVSTAVPVRRLEQVVADGEAVRAEQVALVRSPDDTAYVLYTSGSTGKPKGVTIPHRSIYYSLLSNAEVIRIRSGDVFPCIGSQAFGASILEMLLPLTHGASVKMLKQSQVRDIDQLIASTKDATIMHAVPSLLSRWLDRLQEVDAGHYPVLRTLLVGGESVSDELLRRVYQWRSTIDLVELFGMTEASVVCCSYRPDAEYAAQYCIGTPHSTARFFVLNKYMQLQPPGVPGELYIGGAILASGYINQPELTNERFVDNPFLPSQKLYRTGDRVRQLPDGKFEFLGRVDNQVSLRGVRIECGEIESLMMSHPSIKLAIAHVVVLSNGEKALVAYYATHNPDADLTLLNEELRVHLSTHLPDYMRPTVFQHLKAFPLNPNGKVDRKALPMPKRESRNLAASTPAEHTLVELWQELLGLDRVGIEANFFELGGNSLLATKVVNQCKKRFEIELPVTALFEAPTVHTLAALIDGIVRNKMMSALIYESAATPLAENEILV